MQPMYYLGLDVHKRKISYCVKDPGGAIHSEGSRAATDPVYAAPPRQLSRSAAADRHSPKRDDGCRPGSTTRHPSTHTCVPRTNAPPACTRQSGVQSWSRPASETAAFRHGSLPCHPSFAAATPPSSSLAPNCQLAIIDRARSGRDPRRAV